MKSSKRHISLRTAAFSTAGVLTTSSLLAAGALRRQRRVPEAIVVFGSLAALLALRQLVHLPLLRLNRAISSFSGGNRGARAGQARIREIDQVAKVFNDLAKESSEREQQHLQFLAGVAHDIRNPLTTIQAAIGLLIEEGAASRRVREKLAVIDRQVVRLERLVSDYLDASKIEAGRLELNPKRCDLGEVVLASASLWKDVSARHRIEVRVPYEPIEATCDEDRIRQVVNNLISNAIHFSPGGGNVDVSLETCDGSAVISVRDSGIGIRREEFSEIFKPFHRSGRARELVNGVGLGLSVSRSIVNAHGGTIEVESRPGVGSTFQIVLPLLAQQRKAA